MTSSLDAAARLEDRGRHGRTQIYGHDLEWRAYELREPLGPIAVRRQLHVKASAVAHIEGGSGAAVVAHPKL